MDPAPLPLDLARRPFLASEALARGLSRKRLRASDLWTPTRGVRTADLPATIAELARSFAAAAPAEFAFSHVTAAQLLGIPLPYAVEEDCLVHIVTPTTANRIRRPEVRGHRGLESREVVDVGGLPVVAPSDTWADLGEFVGPGRPVGLDDLIIAGDAVANMVGGTETLRQAVERRVRPRGKVTLTYAIPRIRSGAWSPMETRSRLMVVRAGLPEPRHNISVSDHSGDWLGCGDLVWEEQRVVGEYQGVEFHSRRRDRDHDSNRRDGMGRGGWSVVEIVADDVFDRGRRAAKLRELADHLGVNPHALDVVGADPQFFAPAQFARPRRRPWVQGSVATRVSPRMAPMPGPRLSLSERAQIEVLFGQGLTFPAIAAVIGRDRSTVWREVTRNNSYRGAHLTRPGARHPHARRTRGTGGHLGGPYRWVYEHHAAQYNYRRRARRPHRPKLRSSFNWARPALWSEHVLPKLTQRWSPKQISRWLASTYPDQPELHVSHETIYQAIYLQGRGELRREITAQQALRSGRARRRPQSRTAHGARGTRPWLADFHISTRAAEAADRAVPGHWEGDLVIGARGTSAIITLVERTTRYVMLGSLPHSRVSPEVIRVLTELMRRVPTELVKTLTWDQGIEMRRHAEFTLATDCKVFFCDPHSPWQRGSNENTNGLLRQYFPRSSTDFRTYTQDDLDQVARELNARPRQTLNWQTPAQALNNHLVATAH